MKCTQCDNEVPKRRRGPTCSNACRFWSKVTHGAEADCWPWTGTLNPKGYGIDHIRGVRARTAHRIAWTLTYSAPPNDETFVCHHCDVPGCCNPKHLFLGDNAENMRDMYRKGRVDRKGEKHPSSRLTADQVIAIRADPRSLSTIAADYGCDFTNISLIKRRVNWKHI